MRKKARKEKWGGWSDRNGIAWHVGYLPASKRVALYRMCGNKIDVAARFDDEILAHMFMKFFDSLALAAGGRDAT